MKKILYFLTAVVAVVLVSCTKEQDVKPQAPQGPAQTISFTVSHEADPSTATAIDPSTGNVTWKVGDKMNVVYDGGCVETSEVAVDGNTADFTAEIPAGKEPLFLVYPSSVTSTIVSENLTVTVPAVQNGTFASAAIGVAPYTNPASVLKNLGGLLHLQVASDVDKIVIYGNGDAPLVGSATVTFTDGLPVVTVSGGTNSVTLEGLDGSGDYYAAVLPGSFDAGIYVELYNSGTLVGEKLGCSKLTVARRQIMNLGTIPSSMISNKLFIKVGATGTGSSWDDATGDVATALKNKTDAHIYMAAGEYVLSAEINISGANTSFSLYGGYPADATGTSLAGRDIVNNATEISGNDERRILIINQGTKGKSISFLIDGVTFKNALNPTNTATTANNGSALVFESHDGITMNNCTIKDNKNSYNSNSHGGAVRVKGPGNVKFSNCTFSGNTATKASGGAIVQMNGNLTVENCSFNNNYTSVAGTTGGAVLIFGGSFTDRGSTYSGNYAPSGGAVRVSPTASGTTTASFTGSTFRENYSVKDATTADDGALAGTGIGGAVFSLKGASDKSIALTVSGCEFDGNVAHPSKAAMTSSSTNKGAGSIASIGQYASVRMDDCLFTDDHAGFAAFIINANSTLYINRGRFWNVRSKLNSTVLYNNGGVAAFHNCAFYNCGPFTAEGSTGAINCVINNAAGSLLMASNSFRHNSGTRIIYGGSDAAGESIIVNNVLANVNATCGSFTIPAGKQFTSEGHNLVTTLTNWSDAVSTDVEYQGDTNNPAYTNVYHYVRVMNLPTGFVKATPSDVETAIGHFDSNNSLTGDNSVLTWLKSDALKVNGKTPLEIDIMGNIKDPSGMLPGSYVK